MSAEPVSRPVTDPPIPLRPKFLTRPASEDPKDTGFERRPMVDWLAPGQLIRTGIKSVLSGVFGAYADKRDVMAALDRSRSLTSTATRRRSGSTTSPIWETASTPPTPWPVSSPRSASL
jgi:hypothetical protein